MAALEEQVASLDQTAGEGEGVSIDDLREDRQERKWGEGEKG